jgi:hypothetical protein
LGNLAEIILDAVDDEAPPLVADAGTGIQAPAFASIY